MLAGAPPATRQLQRVHADRSWEHDEEDALRTHFSKGVSECLHTGRCVLSYTEMVPVLRLRAHELIF